MINIVKLASSSKKELGLHQNIPEIKDRKRWNMCVLAEILDDLKKYNNFVFTRKGLISDHLEQIKINTKTKGKTPEMTLNHTIQQLRDHGLVEFTSPGQYRLCCSITELTNFISEKEKGKISTGEAAIKRYLDNKGISYQREKTFSDMKHKALLRMDFYLKEYNTCIEFNGKQHYYPVEYFGGVVMLEQTQKRDQIKTDYCAANNIKLIIIHYKEIKNVSKILNKYLVK